MRERKEALLRGLWVYALTEGGKREDAEKSLAALGIRAAFRQNLGPARHVFTHRIWNMMVYHFEADSMNCREGRFVSLPEMLALPMPTAMRAARDHVLRLLTPKVLRADSKSLPAIAAAYSESWKSSHAAHCSPDSLREHTPEHMEMILRSHLGSGKDVFGLWLNGITVGALVIDRRENELVSLYIHPDYQGLQAGKAAVTFAIGALDESWDMKVTNLCDNERARHLYESFGFRHIAKTRLLNPERNLKEETRVRKGRYLLPLDALHPSQLYISQEKLAAVRAWLDPENLIGFDPLPVKKRADGLLYLTDGHTRAVAAYLAGIKKIPVCDEWEDLDWEMYDVCVGWCCAEGADTVQKLAGRVISAKEYQSLWNERCDLLHHELEEKRREA